MIRRTALKSLAACFAPLARGCRLPDCTERTIDVAQWHYLAHDSGSIDVSLHWLKKPVSQLRPGEVFKIGGRMYETMGHPRGKLFGRRLPWGTPLIYSLPKILPGESLSEPARA